MPHQENNTKALNKKKIIYWFLNRAAFKFGHLTRDYNRAK